MQYKLYHFKTLSSTQDKAKEFFKKGLNDIVIIADVQTNSRGRFKRKWHSSKGGLWMSILLKPHNVKNLQYLTFAAAVAVVKSIKKITGIKTKIKWPNDVHYNGKKLCGILTEGIFGRENHVIVGIGLNANQDNFSTDIRNIATSIKIINNKETSINDLSKNIINEFFKIYNNQYNKNKLENIIEEWKKNCDMINKNIIVISKNKKIYGKAIGIDEDCNLLLELENKKIVRIIGGDIKVRY